MAQEQSSSRNPISLHTCDILEEKEIKQLGQGRFGLILDKGTYDAILLSPQDSKGKGETYVKHVALLNRPGGIFLITSCNWNKEELVTAFSSCMHIFPVFLLVLSWREIYFAKFSFLPDFQLLDQIPYSQISFGGKTGSTVTSVAFRRNTS